MEAITALLTSLRQSGVTVGLAGENLEVSFPEEGISPLMLEKLSASKKEIVAYLQSLQSRSQEYINITPAPAALHYPLSSSQYRVWLTTELEGNTAAYNIPCIIELQGILEPSLLLAAVYKVIEKHEILRTVFRREQTGEIRQWIMEKSNLQPVYTDLRSATDKENSVKELLAGWGNKVFSLETGPLLDFVLLQLENNLLLLAFNIHHIICDGWSIEILIKDVMKQYCAMGDATSPEALLSDQLEIQYKDYAVWQQDQLHNGSFKLHSDYWREKLRGLPPALDIPAANIRPAIKTYNGYTLSFSFNRELSEHIIQWTHKKNGLLLMPLLAAVKGVLYRYTNQEDIIIGTPVSGRNHPALYEQIGFYVNTLPLRTIVDGSAPFANLFEAVRATVLEAMEHQDYPLELLIDELEVKRDVSRSALFDVLVGLQSNNVPMAETDDTDINVKPVHLVHSKTKFDITVMFRESGNQLTFNIHYNTDIYSEEMIRCLGEHIIAFLDNAIRQEQTSINKIDYLTSQERYDLIYRINDTARNYPHNATIVSVFEEQVKQFPGHTALICQSNRITYSELDKRSDELAAFLQIEHQVGRNDFAGIMIERNEWIVIAMLGILKAGAAFVPFDTTIPPERNELIKTDSKCKVILDQQMIARFVANRSKYIHIQRSEKPVATDPAYLIYTSGTTGKPKGVVTSHANIINYHFWFRNAFNINETDSSILLSNIVFSGVYTSVYSTILNGGTLHIVPKLFLQNALDLSQYITGNDISFLKITPSHLDMLVNLGSLVELMTTRLRLLVIGGDRIKVNDLQPLIDKHPQTRLLYHYGATETTMGALTYEINEANMPDFCRQPRLGRPIDNVGVYIVDKHNQLVPKGLIGEICVAGAGLSPGYHNNKQLSAAQFFHPDFNPDIRIYKTGDMGKMLPDDTIAFMGRSDNQVKVRGFRIELTEIEMALLEYKDIKSAKVLPYEVSNGEIELVAYIISPVRQNVKPLRSYLKSRLPEYMIPSWFSQLDSFPLSLTGKVDIDAFPGPGESQMDRGVEYVEPRSSTETQLLAIWKDILGKNELGIMDNFFELGGHSLNFAILINRYARELQVKLSLQEAFVAPTISAHAALVDKAENNLFESIKAQPLQDGYPLSNAQQRLWTLCQFSAVNTALNIPVACVFKGNMNWQALEQSLKLIVERHEILRTVFRISEEGTIRQYIIPPAVFDFKLAYEDLSGVLQDAVAVKERIEKERSHVFRMDTAPLLRACLFKTAAQEHVFSIVIHHIICDRWSMNILIRELMLLYNHICRDMPYTLSPLRIQYKDYAVWQRQLLEANRLDASQAYWERQLSGTLPKLNIRSQKDRPRLMSYNGAAIRTVIADDNFVAFTRLLHQQHSTLFIGLTTITAITLYHFSDQQDLLIGTPFAGREHADLEDQVGFYVNLLPLRIGLNDDDTFITLHEKVKVLALEANQHQIYPLDELLDKLEAKRDASRGALFDVVVSLLDNHLPVSRQEQGFNGVQVNSYEDIQVQKSRFDLLLNFETASGTLHMDINYNTDLFPATLINEMVDCFKKILAAVTIRPNLLLHELIYLKDIIYTGNENNGRIATTSLPDVNTLSEFNF